MRIGFRRFIRFIRADRSNRFRDMAIFRFFKMAAIRVFGPPTTSTCWRLSLCKNLLCARHPKLSAPPRGATTCQRRACLGGASKVRSTSITKPSLVRVGLSSPTGDEQVRRFSLLFRSTSKLWKSTSYCRWQISVRTSVRP